MSKYQSKQELIVKTCHFKISNKSWNWVNKHWIECFFILKLSTLLKIISHHYLVYYVRYKMLSTATWPVWKGSPKDGMRQILNDSKISSSEYSYGKTKLFIRNPRTVCCFLCRSKILIHKNLLIVTDTYNFLFYRFKTFFSIWVLNLIFYLFTGLCVLAKNHFPNFLLNSQIPFYKLLQN